MSQKSVSRRIWEIDWLLPFGIHSPGYASFDYFPLVLAVLYVLGLMK